MGFLKDIFPNTRNIKKYAAATAIAASIMSPLNAKASESPVFEGTVFEISTEKLNEVKQTDPALYKVISKEGELSPGEIQQYRSLVAADEEDLTSFEKRKLGHFENRIFVDAFRKSADRQGMAKFSRNLDLFKNSTGSLPKEDQKFAEYHKKRKFNAFLEKQKQGQLEGYGLFIAGLLATGLGIKVLDRKMNPENYDEEKDIFRNFQLPTLPQFQLPKPQLPTLPQFQLPKPQLPTLPQFQLPKPQLPTLPQFQLPKPQLPTLPQFQLPKPQLPTLPQFQLPKPQLPTLPQFQLPKPQLPTLPQFQLPKPQLPTLPQFQLPKPQLPTLPQFQLPKPQLPTLPQFQLPKPQLPTLPQFQLPKPTKTQEITPPVSKKQKYRTIPDPWRENAPESQPIEFPKGEKQVVFGIFPDPWGDEPPANPPKPPNKNNNELVASAQKNMSIFDAAYALLNRQLKRDEKSGRRQTNSFLNQNQRTQKDFDRAYSQIDKESSKELRQQMEETDRAINTVFGDDGSINPIPPK